MNVARSSRVRHSRYQPSSELVTKVLAGSRPDIARMISRAEGEYAEAADALGEIYRHAGRAHIVGITGVPGGGKSTLIAALIRAFSTSMHKVGVIAVDPSSPYSGGAVLGDRIRMSESAEAGGAFVRSMATRGHLGGLARATLQAADVLDAAGYSPVFIETVGVGQDEVEIMTAAHTVVVLSPPGLGDDIQAIKAGVMEIADIHAVSKSDKPEAAATVGALNAMLALGSELARSDWRTPVVPVSASTGEGIGALKQAIDAHWRHLVDSGEIETRRASIGRNRILATINDLIRRRFDEGAEGLVTQLKAVVDRHSDPHAAASALLGSSHAGAGR